MTKLEEALKALNARPFNSLLLDDVIEAVREEEQGKFAKLVELAKSIAQVSSKKEPRHCGKGPCFTASTCICGCGGCRP
jgi:hypothetical protein